MRLNIPYTEEILRDSFGKQDDGTYIPYWTIIKQKNKKLHKKSKKALTKVNMNLPLNEITYNITTQMTNICNKLDFKRYNIQLNILHNDEIEVLVDVWFKEYKERNNCKILLKRLTTTENLVLFD